MHSGAVLEPSKVGNRENVMLTTKQVIEDRGMPAKLVRAVVRQIGDKESLRDVANHGADGGFCGFTYYRDTVDFFKKNRKEIVDLVNQMADDLGESAADMVAGFNCLGGQGLKYNSSDNDRRQARAEYLPSVYRCLGGGRLTDEDDLVANALAWFALEKVARAFCNE